MKLTDFKVLTFDCYGTLIDWETGLLQSLSALLDRTGLDREQALQSFAEFESGQQAQTPNMRYSDLLAHVFMRLAEHWEIDATREQAGQFGRSIADWPAFPDAPDALAYLKRYYKLVILSNVDRESFAGSNRRLKVEFDQIYTAEDIGSYKPDPRNFEYMLDKLGNLGYAPSTILHTAQSLFHDHVPASRLGLATAWIDRRHDKEGFGATKPPPTEVPVDFHFHSLAEMAAAHETSLET